MSKPDDNEKRARLMRRAAFVGAILALLCQFLPMEHRALCTAATRVVSLTCGG